MLKPRTSEDRKALDCIRTIVPREAGHEISSSGSLTRIVSMLRRDGYLDAAYMLEGIAKERDTAMFQLELVNDVLKKVEFNQQ